MKITTMSRDEHKHAFFCPGCGFAHWFKTDGGGWTWNGDREKPTISPSVLAWADNFRCHSFVTGGQIRFLNDCTHGMKNQTVELPDFPGTSQTNTDTKRQGTNLILGVVAAALVATAAGVAMMAMSGCRSNTPTPPPAPVIVDPVTPPVVPPVVPPVTPPVDPVTPPVTPPAPGNYTDLFPNSLHLWCEAGGADKYDGAALHGNVIVHAIRGKSRKSRTVRTIHPWYDPYKVSPSQAVLDGWFNEARSSGCVAVSVDWEGWTQDRKETERLVAAAARAGLPLILVPKWTLDPGGRYYCGASSQAEVVAMLNAWRVPALLLWLYMGDSAWRLDTIKTAKSIYRNNGYTGQVIGMTDGGMREGGTDRDGNKYNTVAETQEYMRQAKAAGQSVGLFNVPVDHRSLRFALELYK